MFQTHINISTKSARTFEWCSHFNLFPHMSVIDNIMLAPVELEEVMTKDEARAKGA